MSNVEYEVAFDEPSSFKVLTTVNSPNPTSPEPVNEIACCAPYGLPVKLLPEPVDPSLFVYVNSAEPLTASSPAFADTATKEPANADKPIFLNCS